MNPMVIEYSKKRWHMTSKKVTFTDREETRVLYTNDTSDIEKTAERHEHINIVSIEDVTFTEEQKARFNEIAEMKEDFGNLYSAYVENGSVSGAESLPTTHPFNIIFFREEKKKTDLALTDTEIQLMEAHSALEEATTALTDREIISIETIANLEAAMTSVTDLEIEVMVIKDALQI